MKIVNGAIKPEITPLSLEFGGMTFVEEKLMFPKSDITEHLPENEEQIGVYFDDYGCVSRSFLNGLEVLVDKDLAYYRSENRKFLLTNYYKNEKPNFSDRDLVVLSGTEIGRGNNGQKVLDTANDKGIIPESLASWDFKNRDPKVNVPEVYYLYKRDKNGQLVASEFNERFQIVGEWTSRAKLKDAMKYGAVQVYVNAWHKNSQGKYYNPNGKTNHAVLACNYDKKQIYDSYDPFIKELSSWNDIYPSALKINIIEKNMTKPKIANNSLVILVEGVGSIGLYLDDKIIIDDVAKINSVFMARNTKNGFFSGGPVVSLKQDKWDLFEKRNLKMEKL